MQLERQGMLLEEQAWCALLPSPPRPRPPRPPPRFLRLRAELLVFHRPNLVRCHAMPCHNRFLLLSTYRFLFRLFVRCVLCSSPVMLLTLHLFSARSLKLTLTFLELSRDVRDMCVCLCVCVRACVLARSNDMSIEVYLIRLQLLPVGDSARRRTPAQRGDHLSRPQARERVLS